MAGERILVVDDTLIEVTAVEEVLSQEGYQVDNAMSGEKAVELAKKKKYDIVFIDMVMPGMDGIQTCKAIKEISPDTIPIFFTGKKDTDTSNKERQFIHEGGEVYYLYKPLGESVILETVRKALRGMSGIATKELIHELNIHKAEMVKQANDICELNKSLEHRVAERTAELAKANEQLENEIAERKKIEKTLIQSEKLKSMGIVTAGISHEFNNILNIISGNVQLQQMIERDDSYLADSFHAIMRAVYDGAAITDRMLAFTETEDISDELVSADLVEIVNQAIEFTMPRWKTELQARGVIYSIDRKSVNDIPKIMCTPSELRGVFVNIINNAIDAMPDGGVISFSTWNENDKDFISISDTGKGMTEEMQMSVFDPFFTTRRPKGTGLGMSISYTIIKRHGGTIEVESEVGKGTTFTVKLPISTKADSPKVTLEPTQETVGKGLHVLVVDDNKNTCEILDKFLLKEGYIVKVAYNGTDAIELIKSEPFNLVLCDHVMPGVTGCDVARFIGGLEKRPRVGIITGWGDINKCLAKEGVAVDFVIQKPFNFSELKKNINDVIGAENK